MEMFVFDDNDVTIFNSNEELSDTLESQDVARGEYRCFDDMGCEIRLLVAEGQPRDCITLQRLGINSEGFRKEVSLKLRSAGIEIGEHVSVADLVRLVRKIAV